MISFLFQLRSKAPLLYPYISGISLISLGLATFLGLYIRLRFELSKFGSQLHKVQAMIVRFMEVGNIEQAIGEQVTTKLKWALNKDVKRLEKKLYGHHPLRLVICQLLGLSIGILAFALYMGLYLFL